MTSWKTSAATPSPATTPASRAAKTPTPCASVAIVAIDVTSPPGRSSASASATCARIASGSRPAARSSSSYGVLMRGPRGSVGWRSEAGEARAFVGCSCGVTVRRGSRHELRGARAVAHHDVEVAGEVRVVALREVLAPVRSAGLLAEGGGIGEGSADGEQVGGLPRLLVDGAGRDTGELVEQAAGVGQAVGTPQHADLGRHDLLQLTAYGAGHQAGGARVIRRRQERAQLGGQHGRDPPGEDQA